MIRSGQMYEETPIAHVSLDGNDADYLSEDDENLHVTP